MNDWGRVAPAVITRRSELGLTQKDLAAKAAVAERTVQNLEAGKRTQPLIRGKIEKALGWEVGEMKRIAATAQPPLIDPQVEAEIRRLTESPEEAEAALAAMRERRLARLRRTDGKPAA